MYDVIIGRNDSDKQKLGDKGTVFIGKHYVKMGRATSLSNKVFLDVTRAHVYFIVGKRGSGKCVSGNTLISLDDGSRIPIKDLDMPQHRCKRILCLDDNLKIIAAPREEFFKRNVNKLLRITLRSGKVLECTPEHPLLTLKGWTQAADISINGRIACPRVEGFYGDSDLTEAESKILAYLIAEGHIKKPMFFTNADPFIIKDMKDSLSDFCSDMELTPITSKPTITYKLNSRKLARKVESYNIIRGIDGRFRKSSSITHEKTSIRKFLEEHKIYGLTSGEKFIPEKVTRLPKYKLALFLNRLFSCDGSIYMKKTNKNYCWQVSYASKSKVLIDEVAHLLLKFGILSRIREKNILYNANRFLNYELIIDSENVYKYINEIGFFGQKELRARQCLMQMKKSNPNVDTIPKEIWEVYRPGSWAEVGSAMGYKSGKSLRSSINYSPSRQKLLQIATLDCNEQAKMLAQSDIFWDEIIEKEELSGSFEVYDISVPKFHNFIADDIIIHNSYTMGVIAEGISDLPADIKNNISIILLDTMGIYWTMKYPNKKDKEILGQWGLKSKALDVKIYTPSGFFKDFKDKGIPTDCPFSIAPSELDATNWCMSFGIDANSAVGVLIERIIYDLKGDEFSTGIKSDFTINDVIKTIDANKDFDSTTKNAAKNLFMNAKDWGIFETDASAIKRDSKSKTIIETYKATPLSELAKGGQVTVLDLSCYATMPNSWNIKNLVVGLIAEKLFIQRMIARKDEEYAQIHKAVNLFSDEVKKKFDFPMVWLVIDEAHEFLPVSGKTLATDPLVTILREGRQPGISLILATQQPGKIHTDVMTQSDVVIAHRITSKMDTEALGALMQSYMREGLVQQLDDLPREKGAAIIFDDNNEKMYPIKLRPRFTWHGGEDPSALPKKEDGFEKEEEI